MDNSEHEYGTWLATSVFALSFSGITFGVISQQAATYGARYPDDSWLLKLWVYLLWALSAIGTAVDVFNIWRIAHGAEEYLDTAGRAGLVQGITASVAEVMVQIFFLHAIWRVRRLLYPASKITLPVCLCMGLIGIASLVFTTYNMQVMSHGNFELASELLLIKLFLDLSLDMSITVALVKVIQDNRSDFPSYRLRRDYFIRDLVVFLVSRGGMLVICQVVAIILAFKVELITTLMVVGSSIPKIYVWSLLVAVVSRRTARAFPLDDVPSDPRLSTVVIPNLDASAESTHKALPPHPPHDAPDAQKTSALGLTDMPLPLSLPKDAATVTATSADYT